MCANSSCWWRGHLNTVRKWGQLMCLLIWGSEELSKWSWSDISSHRGSCVCCWFKKLFYRLGNDPSRTGGPSQGMACTSLKLRCYLWNCLSEKCAIFQPDKTVTKQTGNRERKKIHPAIYRATKEKREKKPDIKCHYFSDTYLSVFEANTHTNVPYSLQIFSFCLCLITTFVTSRGSSKGKLFYQSSLILFYLHSCFIL